MKSSMQKYNMINMSKPTECIFSFVDNFPIPNSSKKALVNKKRCIYNTYDLGNVEAALFLNSQGDNPSLVLGTNRGIVIRALLSNAVIENEIHLPTAPILQLTLVDQFGIIVATTPAGFYLLSSETMDVIKEFTLSQSQRFYKPSSFYCNIDLKIQDELFNQQPSNNIGLLQAQNRIYLLSQLKIIQNEQKKSIGQSQNQKSQQFTNNYEIKLLFENNFYRATLITQLNLILAINRFGCLSVYGLNGRYMGRFHSQERIIDFKLRPSGIILVYTLSDRLFQVSFSVLHGLKRVHFSQVLGAYPFIDFDVPLTYADFYLSQQEENQQKQEHQHDSTQSDNNGQKAKKEARESKWLSNARNRQLFQQHWQRETEMGISGMLVNINQMTKKGEQNTGNQNFQWKTSDYIVSSSKGLEEGIFYIIQRCNSTALISTNNLTDLDATAFTGRSDDKFLMNQTATANLLATQSAYVIPENDYIVNQRYFYSKLRENKRVLAKQQPKQENIQSKNDNITIQPQLPIDQKDDNVSQEQWSSEDLNSFSEASSISDQYSNVEYKLSNIQVFDKRISRTPDKSVVFIASDSETVHGLIQDYLGTFSTEQLTKSNTTQQNISEICSWPPKIGQSSFNEIFETYKKKFETLHELLQDVKNDCMTVEKKSLVKITAGASGAGTVAGMNASGMNDTDMQCKLIYSPQSLQNHEKYETLFNTGQQHLETIFQSYIGECDDLCPETLGNPWELGIIKQEILDNNDIQNKYKLHVGIKSNQILLTRKQLKAYMQRCDLNDLLRARSLDFQCLKNSLNYSKARDKIYIQSGIGVSLGREMIYTLSFIDYFTPENFGHNRDSKIIGSQETEEKDLLLSEFYEDVEETSESELNHSNSETDSLFTRFSLSSPESYVIEEVQEKEISEFGSDLLTSSTKESASDSDDKSINLSQSKYLDEDIEDPTIENTITQFITKHVLAVGITKYKKLIAEQKKAQHALLLHRQKADEMKKDKEEKENMSQDKKNKDKQEHPKQKQIENASLKEKASGEQLKKNKRRETSKQIDASNQFAIIDQPEVISQTAEQKKESEKEKPKKFSFFKRTSKEKQQDKTQEQTKKEVIKQQDQFQELQQSKKRIKEEKTIKDDKTSKQHKNENDKERTNNEIGQQIQKKGLFSSLKKKKQENVQIQEKEQAKQKIDKHEIKKPVPKANNIFDSSDESDNVTQQQMISSKQLKVIQQTALKQKEEGLQKPKKDNVFQSSSDSEEDSSETEDNVKKNVFESDESDKNSQENDFESTEKKQSKQEINLKDLEKELQVSDDSTQSEDINALREQLQKNQQDSQQSSNEQESSRTINEEDNQSDVTQSQLSQLQSEQTGDKGESTKQDTSISFQNPLSLNESIEQSNEISSVSKHDSNNISKSLSFYKEFPQTSSYSECSSDLLKQIDEQLKPFLLTENEIENMVLNNDYSMNSQQNNEHINKQLFYQIYDDYEKTTQLSQQVFTYTKVNNQLYTGRYMLHLLRSAIVSYGIIQAQQVRIILMQKIGHLRESLFDCVCKQFPKSVILKKRYILLPSDANPSGIEWNQLYLCYDLRRHVKCTAKKIPLNIASASYARSFRALKYFTILRYTDMACSDLNHYFVLTDNPNTFSLYQLLQEENNHIFNDYFKSEKDVIYFTTGLLLTISYLNSGVNKLMHRDLRPSTIWVKLTQNGPQPLIHHVGFMCPASATEKDEMNTFWAAPEVICGAPKEVSDIWSIGTITYAIMYAMAYSQQLKELQNMYNEAVNELEELQPKKSQIDVINNIQEDEHKDISQNSKVQSLNAKIIELDSQIKQIQKLRQISIFSYNKKLLDETAKKQQYINISCVIQMVRASSDAKECYMDNTEGGKQYHIYNDQIARQLAEKIFVKDPQSYLFSSEKQYQSKGTAIIESIKRDAATYSYLKTLKSLQVSDYILCFIQTCWTFDVFQRPKASVLLKGELNYNIENKYVNKNLLFELKTQLNKALLEYDQQAVAQALNKVSYQIDLEKQESSSEDSQKTQEESKSEAEQSIEGSVESVTTESVESSKTSSETETSNSTETSS